MQLAPMHASHCFGRPTLPAGSCVRGGGVHPACKPCLSGSRWRLHALPPTTAQPSTQPNTTRPLPPTLHLWRWRCRRRRRSPLCITPHVRSCRRPCPYACPILCGVFSAAAVPCTCPPHTTHNLFKRPTHVAQPPTPLRPAHPLLQPTTSAPLHLKASFHAAPCLHTTPPPSSAAVIATWQPTLPHAFLTRCTQVVRRFPATLQTHVCHCTLPRRAKAPSVDILEWGRPPPWRRRPTVGPRGGRAAVNLLQSHGHRTVPLPCYELHSHTHLPPPSPMRPLLAPRGL